MTRALDVFSPLDNEAIPGVEVDSVHKSLVWYLSDALATRAMYYARIRRESSDSDLGTGELSPTDYSLHYNAKNDDGEQMGGDNVTKRTLQAAVQGVITTGGRSEPGVTPVKWSQEAAVANAVIADVKTKLERALTPQALEHITILVDGENMAERKHNVHLPWTVKDYTMLAMLQRMLLDKHDSLTIASHSVLYTVDPYIPMMTMEGPLTANIIEISKTFIPTDPNKEGHIYSVPCDEFNLDCKGHKNGDKGQDSEIDDVILIALGLYCADRAPITYLVSADNFKWFCRSDNTVPDSLYFVEPFLISNITKQWSLRDKKCTGLSKSLSGYEKRWVPVEREENRNKPLQRAAPLPRLVAELATHSRGGAGSVYARLLSATCIAITAAAAWASI